MGLGTCTRPYSQMQHIGDYYIPVVCTTQEASTKRCTELAKEVWLLKEQLEELGGGDDKKTTPITDKHLHTHEQVTTADEDAH